MKNMKVPVSWSRRSGARLWREARQRWLVGGVMAAVTLAILAPRLGAPGDTSSCLMSYLWVRACVGGLRAEYTSWVLVSYVHFSAGRRGGGVLPARAQARVHAACIAHAHIVSPALTAAVISALTDGVDYRIVKGVMLWSCGGGCAWLPLSLSSRGAAPVASAFVYTASLLTTPLHTALLCGRASLPSLAGLMCTLCTSAAPFTAGALLSAWLPTSDVTSVPTGPPSRSVQLAALALLYAECCERLCDAEAILYLTDVLVAFALEVCCILVSAAWCALYARAGVLTDSEARLVALCALPRSLDTRWSMSCAAPGMCRLPGVFVAPMQALVLAAMAPAHYDDYDDLKLPDDAQPRSIAALLSTAS